MKEKSSMTTSTFAKFNIRGMDCASCVSKIETAVKRIDGVSDIKVGRQSETLSLNMSDQSKITLVEKAVRGLGYAISVVGEPSVAMHKDDTAGGDHSDHAKPIEGAWWQSSKGLLVIITGVLIGLAYLEQSVLTSGSQWVFLAATIVGTFPVARRAVAALKSGSLFTIEMLMSIAVIGAIAINATEEAAFVVFLFAVG